jgi:GntR family transcriptional regulator / MocR family aminotransferase
MRLYGMSRFRAATGARPPRLVLGFGQVSERAIEPAIAAVADLLT